MSSASIDTLVQELSSAGDLPAELGSVLRAVPREQFVPGRMWVNREPIDRATSPDRWLAAVYSNESIVTQFDDGATRWPHVGRIPTCSTSMPSAVVGMLRALRVEQGRRVLEIGTGTGWNAALLTELVGPTGHVATIELDADVAAVARANLARAGRTGVSCSVGDGGHGIPESAPFDRIIATMSVYLGRVPYSWVEQTQPGGYIVAPVRADLASGPLVRFTVHGDGSATGRTLDMGVGFMVSRRQRVPRSGGGLEWEQDGIDGRETTVKPWPMLEVPSARWAIAVAVPSVEYDIEPSTKDRPYRLAWLHDPVSGSWASVVPVEVDSGRYVVRQAGPRRLWDQAQLAYEWWHEHGSPFITQWQWRITPDSQTIRLAT